MSLPTARMKDDPFLEIIANLIPEAKVCESLVAQRSMIDKAERAHRQTCY